MKKNYLSLLALLFSVFSFAQSDSFQKIKDFSIKSNKFDNHAISSSIEKAPPFWTNDFSDASQWTMIDHIWGGTQNWVIGTNGPVGSYSSPMGAIASTTASNGFALYDSDALNTAYTNQDATLTYNGTIDCSSYQYVNIEFESYHRKFHDSVWVEISTDSISWDRYEVHEDLDVTDISANPVYYSINISASASYEPIVYFRFHYEGEWDYAWMLDDVAFSETPDNEMTISDAVHGGWWVGYLTSGGGTGDGYDYTFNPLSQIAANPYSFEAVLRNGGIAPQNTTLYVEVTNDAGTNVYSDMSNTVLLNMTFPQDTFVANSTFSPTQTGVYDIKMYGQGDSVTTDPINLATIVTDHTYGRDWNSPDGYWRVGRSCGGMVLGTKMDIYANENLYAIQAHIDDESVVGTSLFGVLYEYDDATGDKIFIAQTDDYTITPAHLGQWINLPFDGYEILSSGLGYVAAVGGYANPVDTFMISTSGNSQGASCFIQDNGCDLGSGSFGDWYWISSVPMIRMSFDPANVAVEETLFKDLFNVYPNPNNGEFSIEINTLNSGDYLFRITNILGEEVYKSLKSINSLFTEKLDLSHLQKGIYLLEISNSDAVVSEKIVIE